jgi:hypothetical protein
MTGLLLTGRSGLLSFCFRSRSSSRVSRILLEGRGKRYLPGMTDPGSRPASGGSTEHLCQLSLGKWISGLNAHLVSRYRFVICVISGIFSPEGVVIAGLLARPPSFLGS